MRRRLDSGRPRDANQVEFKHRKNRRFTKVSKNLSAIDAWQHAADEIGIKSNFCRCWTQRTEKPTARRRDSHGRTSPPLKWKRVALKSPARDVEDDHALPSTPTPPKAPVLPSRKPAAGTEKQSLKGMRRRKQDDDFCNECRSRAGRSLGPRRPASVPRRLRPKLRHYVQNTLCHKLRSRLVLSTTHLSFRNSQSLESGFLFFEEILSRCRSRKRRRN